MYRSALLIASCTCGTEALPLDEVWTLPTILLAGVVDGFNPCAFSVAILLAGILAAGSRAIRAHLAGGISFCVASYFTYLAMGLGLLRAVRALAAFHVMHHVAMTLLAMVLFVLAIFSARDAFRYRQFKTPHVITLQLPAKVKAWIRAIAESSWRGPAVVGTGLACGFVVTLLDSLCTGQVYLPIVAILSRAPGSARALALLAIYNLAFILPLLAIFILAAIPANRARLATWSKRNVFPSKLALALVFAVLGALVFPRFGDALAHLWY